MKVLKVDHDTGVLLKDGLQDHVIKWLWGPYVSWCCGFSVAYSQTDFQWNYMEMDGWTNHLPHSELGAPREVGCSDVAVLRGCSLVEKQFLPVRTRWLILIRELCSPSMRTVTLTAIENVTFDVLCDYCESTPLRSKFVILCMTELCMGLSSARQIASFIFSIAHHADCV